jgi:hypothetical protein
MTTNKNFRVKNGLEVGADGIKFADDTVMTTAATGSGSNPYGTTSTKLTVAGIDIEGLNTSTLKFSYTGEIAVSDTFAADVEVLARGTALDDESTNNFAVTASGSAVAGSTGQTNLEAGSFYSPGTTSDYITIADGTLVYSSTPFTIDFSVYTDANATSGIKTMASQWGGGNRWIIQGGNDSNEYYALVQANGQQFVFFTITPGQWNHIAVVREDNTTLKVYVNGVLDDTNTNINGDVNTGSGDITLFINGEGNQQPFSGYIEDFRITSAARYTGGFTPPAAASEYSLGSIGANAASIKIASIEFADGTSLSTAVTGGGGSGIISSETAPENTATLWLDLSDPNGVGVIGVPAGGTTGQVLAKVDGTDYNFSWTTSTSGGAPGATSIYTRSTLPAGSTGTIITISDSASDPNSATFDSTLAYWDPVDELWKYVFNNLEVQEPIEGVPIDYLVVAGGGGGGEWNAGGGGAGGMTTGSVLLSTGTEYTITVGAGGAGGAGNSGTAQGSSGSNGSNSVFDTVTTIGGGGGGAYFDASPTSGGSGGGAGWITEAGGAGTAGQGNAGGSSVQGGSPFKGAGGGGAGAAGENNAGGSAGVGGIGLLSNITGTPTYYAGGGGSGGNSAASDGGLGGGGAGGAPGNNGTANTGGGGGGGSSTTTGGPGGNGGSGVVIIRHLTAYAAASATTGSPDISVVGDYRIYKFTSSGTITF